MSEKFSQPHLVILSKFTLKTSQFKIQSAFELLLGKQTVSGSLS